MVFTAASGEKRGPVKWRGQLLLRKMCEPWAQFDQQPNADENKAGLKDNRMKHNRAITRKPQIAQVSPTQVVKDFLIALTDQVIEFIFQLTD